MFSKKTTSDAHLKEIKATLKRRFGRYDGVSMMELFNDLGVSSSLRFYERGVEIPGHLIENAAHLQTQLRRQSVAGRTYPMEIVDGYIRIHCGVTEDFLCAKFESFHDEAAEKAMMLAVRKRSPGEAPRVGVVASSSHSKTFFGGKSSVTPDLLQEAALLICNLDVDTLENTEDSVPDVEERPDMLHARMISGS